MATLQETASLTKWISTGGPSIWGRGLWGHLLKVDDANRSRSQTFISGTFAIVGAKGRWAGGPGGGFRPGQPQSVDAVVAATMHWGHSC